MKTMKHIIAAIAVMSTAVAAAADDQQILWGVENPKLSGGESVAFDYATIQAQYSDGTMFYLYDTGYGSEWTRLYVWDTPGLAEESHFGWFDAANIESFVVQLYQYGEVGSTDTLVAWNTFSADGWYKLHFGPKNELLSPFYVTQVIPEPTSGLLLLFGVAGLALKRRRQAV